MTFARAILLFTALFPMSVEAYSCSDYLLDALEALGVTTLFGVPGGAIEPLFNVLDTHIKQNRCHFVLTRSEAGAGFMAHGYYIESNRMGVAVSTSGPGATNLLTATAAAAMEHAPLLLITAQPATTKLGKLALQDSSDAGIDVVAMFKECTKYSTLVSHPGQFAAKLKTALTLALESPRGPVHLSVPSDVLGALLSERPDPLWFDRLNAMTAGDVPRHALSEVASQWKAAAQPVILLGERSEAASTELMALIEHLNAPVLVTAAGKGWFPWSHPMFKGVVGFAGHLSAEALLRAADTVLAVGVDMSELGTNQWASDLFGEKLIIVDDQRQSACHWAGKCRIAIGDIATTANSLRELVPQTARPATDLFAPPEAPADSSFSGAVVMAQLAKLLPHGTHVYLDAGNTWSWAIHYLPINAQVRRTRIGMGWGCMAWGISSAIGAKVALPDTPVACVTGDGAWLMSSQELSTAVAEKLPVVFIVLNDSAFGMVRHGQRMGGAASIAHELPLTDFAALAIALGARGLHVNSEQELAALPLAHLMAGEGPLVLDVRVDPEAVPPIGKRVKTLGQ